MSRGQGCLLALLFTGPACAQVSGSVTLLSDDRYQGISRSAGNPAAQFALAWDGDGWYAGLQLSRVRFRYADAGSDLQAVPYLGYAYRLRPGLTGDVGVQYTWFPSSQRYSEPEMYLGLSGERVQARVSWSPHYYGRTDAWHATVDVSHPLRGRLRAIAHAGALHTSGGGGEYGRSGRGSRYDVAAGFGMAFRSVDVQVSWTAAGGDLYATCGPWRCDSRTGWVLRLTRNW